MYNNDDHIAIPNCRDPKNARIVEKGPAKNTQDVDNFETWIKQVEDVESQKQYRVQNGKNFLHFFLLKICPTANVDQNFNWFTSYSNMSKDRFKVLLIKKKRCWNFYQY